MNLMRVALVVSILLTALAVYDITKGDYGVSVWVGVICWPVVAIVNCIELYRLRRTR